MLALIDLFYQNRFMNECARKKLAKILVSHMYFLWDVQELMFLNNNVYKSS